jgi:hypothetical protein
VADNFVADPGAGGDTFAADDIGGVKYPRGKVVWGADGAANDCALTAALPVQPGTGATFTVGSHDVTNAGTFAVQASQAGTWNIGTVTTVTTVSAVTAITNALPAGTNNIGDVDVLTVPAPLSTTGGGTEATALRVTVASDSTGVLSVDDNGSTLSIDDGAGSLTVDGTVAATQSGSWTVLPGNTANTTAWLVTGTGGTFPVTDSGGSLTVDNGGTFAVQVDGSALTALQLLDNTIIVDDAAFTPATTSVNMAGFQADETATDSVDEGDAGAARMTLDRKQIVTPQPHTTGGLTIFRSLDLDETEEEVKATAGQVYGVWVTNLATTTRFVKFYNATAANVVVGTTTPVITLAIPGNTSDDVTGLFSSTMGIAFDTAITVAATTGIADADTGAPAANDVLINVFYK